MQVKPCFESYKILEQHFITKDDTHNDMSLTLLEVKLKSDDDIIIDSSYRFWAVMGGKKEVWANKAESYESIAFWENPRKPFINTIINGFSIEEVLNGGFYNEKNKSLGIRTKFKIERVN